MYNFEKALEAISISGNDKDKLIAPVKRIKLDEIIAIAPVEVATILNQYEEQQNLINAMYFELFYNQGYNDGLDTKK